MSEVLDAVLNGGSSSPLEDYVASHKEAYNNLLAVESTQKDNHGVGNKVSRTTAEENKEAKTFRFNAGTLFDVYAPQTTLNTSTLLTQSKSHFNQVFHSQTSSVYSWLRAQNLSVLEAANHYTYATDKGYHAASNHFLQTSYNNQYSDYFRLQVGQSGGDPVSKTSRLDGMADLYGCCNIGAYKDFTVSTKEGLISMASEDGFIAKANGAVSVSGKKGVSISSSLGANITAKSDLSISSMGPTTVSSTTFLSLNSGAVMYIDAGIILVGMGAGVKPSVSLDTVSGTLGALTSTLAGSGFSVGSIVSLASAVASGNIQGAVTSLAGALIPGAPADFLSKAASFTPAGLASAFTGLLTGGEGLGGFLKGQLGSLFSVDTLSEALPGITDIPGVSDLIDTVAEGAFGPFLNFLGDPTNGFVFKTYPKIDELSPYTTASMPQAQPMLSNSFTAEIASPVLSIQTAEQVTAQAEAASDE